MLNKVMLIGKVTKVTKNITSAGSLNVRFTVSTFEPVVSKQTGKRWRADHHKCVAWGQTAEFCQDRVANGGIVYVEGRIRYNVFSPPGQSKKYFTEIFVETVKLMDRISSDSGQLGTTVDDQVDSQSPVDDGVETEGNEE